MEQEHKKSDRGVEQPVEYRALAWVAIIGIVVVVYFWAQQQSYDHCVAVEKGKGPGKYSGWKGNPEACR